jgi:TM2 domain-containing membrane protein YozV
MILCQNCGFNNPQGVSFCSSCGQPLPLSQPTYGYQPPYGGQPPYGYQPPYGGQPPYWNQPYYGGQPPYGGQGYISHNPPKSHTVAMILCFFFGVLGVHRFYMGKIVTGILMLVTYGGFGIWMFVDMIIFIFSNFNDGDGRPLEDKNNVVVIIFGILYLFYYLMIAFFIFIIVSALLSSI